MPFSPDPVLSSFEWVDHVWQTLWPAQAFKSFNVSLVTFARKGPFFPSCLVFIFHGVTLTKIVENAPANLNFKKNQFIEVLERLLGLENMHDRTQPIVTCSFSANFFCWVCSKNICISFGFHSRDLCHRCWWWLWWSLSPRMVTNR